MKINVNELVIEVGRQCNLKCKHCLRGPSQNVTVSFEAVKRLLSYVSCVGCLVFTGGEPTLYGNEIAEIIKYIMESKISVGYFYIATNGVIYNPVLMNSLIEFYGYVDEPDMCDYEFSTDIYHEESYDELHTGAFSIRDPRFGAFSFIHQRGALPEAAVIREGYAEQNGLGGRHIRYDQDFTIEVFGNDAEIDMLYLTAKGGVAPHCDFSYETFDSLPLFYIDEINSADELVDAVFDYNDTEK